MTYIKRDLEPKIISLSREYSVILITGPGQVNISCYEGHRYAFEIHQYT